MSNKTVNCVETVFWTPESIKIDYSQEQTEAIKKSFAKQDTTGFCTYHESSELVFRGKQTFLIFGSEAYQLLENSKVASPQHGTFEYVPVFRNESMLFENPMEGNSGILYLMRHTNTDGKVGSWTTTFVHCQSLSVDELNMTNQEIYDRIESEVDRGMNVITGK